MRVRYWDSWPENCPSTNGTKVWCGFLLHIAFPLGNSEGQFIMNRFHWLRGPTNLQIQSASNGKATRSILHDLLKSQVPSISSAKLEDVAGLITYSRGVSMYLTQVGARKLNARVQIGSKKAKHINRAYEGTNLNTIYIKMMFMLYNHKIGHQKRLIFV